MAVEEEIEPDATVADPEEYNQTRRLRAINESRQRVEEAIEESMIRLVSDSEFDESDRRQVIRAVLYRYLTNLEWLMVESGADEFLAQQELGKVSIGPPQTFVELANRTDSGYPRLIGSPDLKPFERTITGIRDYMTAGEYFEKTWTATIEYRHDRPKTVSESRGVYMPVNVSLNAFRTANRFLNQAGVDVDLKTEQHRAVIDREVLEEIEEWRKQNIE